MGIQPLTLPCILRPECTERIFWSLLCIHTHLSTQRPRNACAARRFLYCYTPYHVPNTLFGVRKHLHLDCVYFTVIARPRVWHGWSDPA